MSLASQLGDCVDEFSVSNSTSIAQPNAHQEVSSRTKKNSQPSKLPRMSSFSVQQRQCQNAFSVSKTFQPDRERQLMREDLDIPRQLQQERQRQLIACHEANWKDFTATCASRQAHRLFIHSLLGEAERYHASRPESQCSRELLREKLLETKRRTENMLEDAETLYPKALSHVSAQHLFIDPIATPSFEEQDF